MFSRRFVAALLAPAALVLAATLMTSQGAYAVTERCPDGGIKLGDSQREYCSQDGIITSVCIKAGTRVYSFFADDEKCYTIKGIGTDCVTIGGGGTGRDCKDISGITVYVDKK
ncbi:MAG: hypothetical protein ABIS67_01040 [Candidatus Eisenbacteria bacterium]